MESLKRIIMCCFSTLLLFAMFTSCDEYCSMRDDRSIEKILTEKKILGVSESRKVDWYFYPGKIEGWKRNNMYIHSAELIKCGVLIRDGVDIVIAPYYRKDVFDEFESYFELIKQKYKRCKYKTYVPRLKRVLQRSMYQTPGRSVYLCEVTFEIERTEKSSIFQALQNYYKQTGNIPKEFRDTVTVCCRFMKPGKGQKWKFDGYARL